MLVLGSNGLDVIVSTLWKQNVGAVEQFLVIGALKNLLLDRFDAVKKIFTSEVPTVVTESEIIGGQILPRPIESGELTERRIFI